MMNTEIKTTYTFDSSILSDLHKDAFGVRPGQGFWRQWNESTNDEKQQIWDGLCDVSQQEADREKQLQEIAVADFEGRIAQAQFQGAPDRATAIRWMCQAYGVEDAPGTWGWEHLEYELGIPYGYIEGKPNKYG